MENTLDSTAPGPTESARRLRLAATTIPAVVVVFGATLLSGERFSGGWGAHWPTALSIVSLVAILGHVASLLVFGLRGDELERQRLLRAGTWAFVVAILMLATLAILHALGIDVGSWYRNPILVTWAAFILAGATLRDDR